MPGQELEVTAGIGAFSKLATPTITINGTTPPLTNGSAVYKTVVNGAGEKSVRVNIKYVKPDGSTGEISKDIKYTVGVPSYTSGAQLWNGAAATLNRNPTTVIVNPIVTGPVISS
jgi:hypothetical protein